MSHLKPVSINNDYDQSSLMELAKPFSTKDGKRKQKRSAAAQMITHRVCRRKKSEEQVRYLRNLFFQLGGEWDGKVRKEAMIKTGLSRI